MSKISINVDDITSQFSDADFEPKRPELREEVFFEMKVDKARITQAKSGHLQLVMQLAVLDGDAKKMGTVFNNVALPVSYKGVAPHWDAKTGFLRNIKPLVPELSAYDTVETDPATGKKVYRKGGEVVSPAAFNAADKAIADKAVELAKAFAQAAANGETEVEATDLIGKHIFATLKRSEKNGYVNTNLGKITSRQPDEVIYDRKMAYRS